jgi:hypothetical protein
MLDAFADCNRAVQLEAAIDGRPEARLAWQPDILALRDACDAKLARLDSATLTIRD